MTLEHLKHSAILTTLFKMAEDGDLIGASEFIKGEFYAKLCLKKIRVFILHLNAS